MKPIIYGIAGAVVGAAIATGVTFYVVKHPNNGEPPVPEWAKSLPMMGYKERHVSPSTDKVQYLLKPEDQAGSTLPEVWLRVELRDPLTVTAPNGQLVTFFSSVMKVRVNCADKTYQTTKLVVYTARSLGGRLEEAPMNGQWQEAIPSSGAEQAVKFACKG